MNIKRAFALAVVLFALRPSLAACDQLPKGAVGWWPGDGNANDISAAANHGTLLNGATLLPGLDGQGFSLDGVDDRIDVPDNAALRPQQMTVAAWAKLDVAGQSSCVICKQFGSSTTNSYSLWMSGGVLRGGMFNIAEAVAPLPLPGGTWVHVAFTYDGAIIRLYIDAEIVATLPGPAGPVPYDTNPVIIGTDDNGINAFQGFFDGIIDEPVIFNRALDNCELRALWQARYHALCKGDADADARRDFQDNCPAVANAAQIDTDADGTGDTCDCAPIDASVRSKPGDYAASVFISKNRLDWCGEPAITGASTSYDVIRGNLNQLPVGAGAVGCRSHCLPPPTGVAGWWPGDGNANALVGGLNGTLENGAAIGPALVRQGFVFDGVDDRVRTAAMTTGNTFSVAAWVNSDVLIQGGTRRIVETAYNTGFYLGTDNAGTGYKWIVRNGVSPFGTAEGGKISPGEWQFLVGTYDGATGVLYVDGAPVGSGGFTPPGTVSLPVNIGAYFLGGFGWKGRIDEVQIFNRALTPAEIVNLYEAASAGACKAALGGVDALFTAPWDPDTAVPAPGQGFWYLFHGNNSCGSGTYGFRTSGAERLSTVCN